MRVIFAVYSSPSLKTTSVPAGSRIAPVFLSYQVKAVTVKLSLLVEQSMLGFSSATGVLMLTLILPEMIYTVLSSAEAAKLMMPKTVITAMRTAKIFLDVFINKSPFYLLFLLL